MAKLEEKMFGIVNRNHDLRVFADKLNAISAGRKHRKSVFWRIKK